MKIIKKPVSILLSLMMIVSLFTIIPFEAEAATSVTLYNHHWDSATDTVVRDPLVITDYTELSKRTSDELESGYYTVKKDTTVNERLHVASGGTVGIYLGENATLTSYGGIRVDKGATLNIYSATSTSGKLIIDTNKGSKDYLYCAAIGSDDRQNAGTINIHGGKIDITADHGAYGACIGGGNQAAPECVTIWDGDIYCHRDETDGKNYYFRAAAIGGGDNAPVSCNKSGEGVRIFGGKVYAKGNGGAGIGTGSRGRSDYAFDSDAAIAIYGGDVTAYSRTGAGIGGGTDLGYNGPVNIYGGTVNAMSVGEPDYDSGAGIGGGMLGNQRGAINISGGTVFATGAEGAGIGGGDEGNATVINITGGCVVANATMGGAGIGGGCEGDNGTVTISGAETRVSATSETYKDGQAWSDAMDKGIKNTNFYSEAHKYYATAMLIVQAIVELFGGEDSGCGIGGGYKGRTGTITIDGSTVYAAGGAYSAAIGSGDEGKGGGKITIRNGANVTADSGTDAAAIGSGNEVDEPCDITISNSTVVAHGGDYAAGIGGGDEVDGGTITIKNNSVVKAYGGKDGAGIGGGEDGEGGKIVIENSDVTATGGAYGAGIGGGEDKGLSSIEIHGNSRVEAIAGSDGNSVAIGHGDYNTFWASLSGNYPSNGTFYFSENYLVSAGSDKDNTSEYNRFSSPSSYNACCNNKYALIHSCDHKNAVWCAETGWYHLRYCKDCGASFDYSNHRWGPDNKCIDCGASAEMVTIKFVERNNNGEVTRTIEMPRYSKFIMPEPENTPDGYTMYYWSNGSNSFIKPGEEMDVSDNTYTAVYFETVETNYIDKDGIQQTVTARRLPKTECSLQSGWYVIDYDSIAEDTERISYSILGDVNLILADGITWSNTNAGFMNFGNRQYEFSIYGQKEQTGTIDILNVDRPGIMGTFYNLTQYGGVVRTRDLRAINNFTFAGGNGEIRSLRAANKIELGWTRWNDSFRADTLYEYQEIRITDGKPLQIQDNDRIVFNPGQLSSDMIGELTEKTLVPATNLKYNNPQWTWSDDGTKAEAFFKCRSDSAYDATIKADVTYTDEGAYRDSTATVKFKKTTYTDTHTVRIRWNIYKGSRENGDMEFSENPAAPGTKVHVNVIPDEGYAVKSITAVPSDASLEVNVNGDSFKMPASDVTVNVDFAALVPASEPYINSNGEYILGTIEHYEADGKYYAVNDDGSLGAELTEEETYISYFDFKLINNDTEYQINYYTGPTDTLTELVIPKTFNAKKITVLGNDVPEPLIDYTDKAKTQFELTLNENITRIKNRAFYTMWVTKIKGDTSNLRDLESYAFSWANSPGGYNIDIKLDYPGVIRNGLSIFNNMNVTARIKHATSFDSAGLSEKSITYVFTDAHTYGIPDWEWEDDYSAAKATLTCADSRCNHVETVDATVTAENRTDKIVYTATAELDGNTYNDVKEKNKVKSEVSVLPVSYGAVYANKSSAYEGDEITITIIPNEDYKLKTLNVTAGTGDSAAPIEVVDNKFIMPAQNVYIKTEFAKVDHSITYESTEGGWVSGVYSAGWRDKVELTVTPASGYELESVTATSPSGNIMIDDNKYFTMPASDVTVRAVFRKKDLNIRYVITGEGTVSGAQTAQFNDRVPLTVAPAEGYALNNYYAETDDDDAVSAYIIDGELYMPDTDVVVYAEFVPVIPAKAPYIDENGEYHLGNVEYCDIDGVYFAVRDGVTGDEVLDNVDVSYFEFTEVGDDYNITYYTGPTENLTELVIPKTFNGRKITAIGTDDEAVFISSNGAKSQFTLVLNENIKEIKQYSFYTMWVEKVRGDTSGLNKLGKYAFSWANSPGGYAVDLKLDYIGTIQAGSSVFNHMKVTAHMSHRTKFSFLVTWAQSVVYDFTDAHPYGTPEWEWESDFSGAAAEFSCSDSRCNHSETVDASVTSAYADGAPVYTARAVFQGDEYTDVTALTNPLDELYSPGIDAATALDMDGNLFNLPGELVYTRAKLLGIQKKEAVKTDTAGAGIRFIAELSSELLGADDYGFEVVKTSQKSTAVFNEKGGFEIMQRLIDSASDNIKAISCKGTTNNITGDVRFGDNDKTSTAYKYVTLAVTDIPETQGIAVRFYVDLDGIRYYSGYTNGDGNVYRGCCARYDSLPGSTN